jgi:hypothetical protein
MSTTSSTVGSTTCASSTSGRSKPAVCIHASVGGRRRVPPEDCGGPWAFLELRERYSLLTIADRLSELAECRLGLGYEAFVHDHYEDVQHLLEWLEIDRFDRRAANRRLAGGAVVQVAGAA